MHALLKDWAPKMKEALFFLNHVTELRFYVIDGQSSSTKMYPMHHYDVNIDQTSKESRAQLHKTIATFTGGNSTPDVTLYPLTVTEIVSQSSGSNREKWLIQQGVGDIDNSDQSWMYISQVKPRHGIAAPLPTGSKTFKAKAFCFLPLPKTINLPVHVNGNFILDAARRDLWQPTPGESDDRSKWNERLLEANASSYVKFLVDAQCFYISRSTYDSPKSLQKDIKHYYSVFPTWRSKNTPKPEGCFLDLAQTVYKKLGSQNAKVLVTIRKVRTRADAQHKHFTVEWHPLHSCGDPSQQVYFWYPTSEEEKVAPILESIGMNLTAAPPQILEHFHEVEVELFKASRETVFEYYSKFAQQATPNGQFPCPVTESVFQTVANFKMFSQYLLNIIDIPPTTPGPSPDFSYLPLSSQATLPSNSNEFPGAPFGFPLLLTDDGQLRKFDEADKAIDSKHSKLFPKMSEKFLHPELLSLDYAPSYFLMPSPDNLALIVSLLSSVLPDSLRASRVHNANNHISITTVLKPLWQCLLDEPVFSLHLEHAVKTWAILPSDKNQLYSFRSIDQLLPVVPLDSQTYGTVRDRLCENVFRVLQQMNMPMLDTSVVGAAYILGDKDYCPQLSQPARILTNLYWLHREGHLATLLDDRGIDAKVRTLFTYFGKIHFAQEPDSLRKIKSLPLFKNIDGNLCSIDGETYIWPGHICQAGREKWIAATNAVFLKKNDVWTNLGPGEVLGVQEISPHETYTRFIFPNFHLLTREERFKHLQHIRDELFDDAERDQESKGDRRWAAIQFISGLKQLPCLEDNGTLKPVCEFVDPKVDVFRTFCEHFSFPPRELSDEKWLEFFRNIGLRTKVTEEEFIQFCNQVASGRHKDLHKASDILLKYLFRADEWYEKYEFLHQVSQIPFVRTEKLPGLSWIRPAYQAENRIQAGEKTIDMNRLDGAVQYRDCKLVWTVKPVVSLPSLPRKISMTDTARKFYEKLGLIRNPSTSDVVENVHNISQTRFSSFNLFEKYTDECKPKRSSNSTDCLLLEIMVANFEFLKKENCPEDTLHQLKEVPCIPVCAEGGTDVVTHPVLVLPLQVVACNTPEIQQLQPFLNPLPNDLYPVLPVLSLLGVENNIHPRHVRMALETAYNHVTQPLDPNTQQVVIHLIKKLYNLLQEVGSGSKAILVDQLRPLYLPNKDCELVESTSLLYTDTPYYRKGSFSLSGAQYSFFSILLPRFERSFSEKQLCRSLPSEISPKALSTSCEPVLHESCIGVAQQLSQFAQKLQKSFALSSFSQAARAILRNNSNSEEVCIEFATSLERFLKNTTIISVNNLMADVYLTLTTPEQLIGTVKVDFLLQKKVGSFSLYIDNDANPLGIYFFDALTNAIVACVAEMSGIDLNDLKEPDLAISLLLKAETGDDIASILEELEISLNKALADSLQGSLEYNLQPKLGRPIPDSWHHRLQMDLNHIFRPQEWVGYEESEGRIIFACIVHRILREEHDLELDESELITDQYLIQISEDDEEGKVVSVLDIYKISAMKQLAHQEDCKTVMTMDEESEISQLRRALDSENLKAIKQQLCKDLRQIWKLPEEQRRKAIKRLYLKWHPDKNDHPLATKAFQFLQHQIARLEAGLDLEEPEDEEGSTATYETPQTWRYWYGMWDNTASSHRRARQREYSFFTSSGGFPSGTFDFVRPRPEPATARVWIRQAEADMKALKIILAQVDNEQDVCGNVCFLAHEVAEKALKAGMYAVCGLHPESLKHHALIGHAGALEQERRQLVPGLRAYACALEDYYLKTRFPNRYTPPSVPAEKYTPSDARDAAKIAQIICDMLKHVVDQS